MLSFLRILVTVALGGQLFLFLSGCGHIDANYPQSAPVKSALPEEFKTPDGGKTVLVWDDPGRVHGFLSKWRDTSERAKIFWDLAATSGLPVHKEAAKMYEDLSANGIAEASIWVFMARGLTLPCRTGDFQVGFEDGSTARDQGVLYVETKDPHKPYRYSLEGRLKLNADIVGKGQPLRVILFLDKANLGKTLTRVSYLPAK